MSAYQPEDFFDMGVKGAYERIRVAIRARLREIGRNGQWHQEEIVAELEMLIEEIDRIEKEAGT